MILYDLITESRASDVPKKGCIWTKDGLFMSPSNFIKSKKEAYGYCLNDHTAVRLLRSLDGECWTSVTRPGSAFYEGSGATSMTDGVANCEVLKSIKGFDLLSCPAVYEACSQVNVGIESYMPAVDELSELYESIMQGQMREDLKTAGILGLCNYRLSSFNEDSGWIYVWSSTEYSGDEIDEYFNRRTSSWYVRADGAKISMDKTDGNYVIPFFKI